MRQNKHVFVLESESESECGYALEPLTASGELSVHVFRNSDVCLQTLSREEIECHLVIISVQLSDWNRWAVVHDVRALRPSVPIIVAKPSGNVPTAFEALRMGVYDFIERPLDARRLVSSVRSALATHPGRHLPVKSLLSKTEYEVLNHILKGETTKQIAFKRHRSIRTIEDHRYVIMKKLQADNIVDLIKRVAYVVLPVE